MKKLLLIRHAEAEPFSNEGDIARPLSKQGEQDALALAQKLKHTGNIPTQIVSSSALRTAKTAEFVATQLGIASPQLNDHIYEASEKVLLKTINHFNDQHDFIALVGHNPGIAYLLLSLTGKIRDVPPCTAALIVFEDAEIWLEADNDMGVITYYTTPGQP